MGRLEDGGYNIGEIAGEVSDGAGEVGECRGSGGGGLQGWGDDGEVETGEGGEGCVVGFPGGWVMKFHGVLEGGGREVVT